ncbi:ABC transporter permease [Pectobacterium brasiliense]|uniref:ABC transporter permease n=1 Tax=Pectobacterium brasiliense TaxID=180957 RepID=UPI0004E694D1|nr:ABC transporter permease [Pectobacterium brasiliense]ATV43753.1 ABC transporter permease [Pectobacterium brasiliense]KFF71037.1 ABC transporter permease [Pectobacterium brasiliense]MCA6981885.1 ABC transporter permease [Pectobacterium brasiliense]MCH4991441.1 ABC transporter permease [Pectobacterium brasiliense]
MNHLSPENLTPKKAAADGVSSAATRPLKMPFRLSPEVRAFVRNPAGMAGLLLLITVFLMAAFAPLLYPGDPLDMVAKPFLWPGENPDFPLGTDSMGRDVAAGIVHGSQVSLQIGFSAVIVSLLIGTVVGALAGYFGGRVDDLLVHITELFQTFPTFLLVVVLVAIGSPSVTLISLAIGIASWPTIARLVRAEFRSLRESDFVLAARSQGFSSLRIIFQEILPNALPSIIVTTSVMVASAILIESALSFLGFGDPNRVSWGSMIGAGRESLRTAWFLTALPGTALVLTVLSLNLVGDALNDALNPRLRGRSA